MANSEDRSTPDTAGGAVALPGDTAALLGDELLLPADLAALYLCITPAQLGELRTPTRRADGSRGKAPPAIAYIASGVPGAGQSFSYTLGALRAYEGSHAGRLPQASGPGAGLQAWVSTKLPFFAELEAREQRGPRTLIANAWDRSDAQWAARFRSLVDKRVRFTWLTSAEAVTSRWSSLAGHRALADQGVALLQKETRAIEAALQATSLGESSLR